MIFYIIHLPVLNTSLMGCIYSVYVAKILMSSYSEKWYNFLKQQNIRNKKNIHEKSFIIKSFSFLWSLLDDWNIADTASTIKQSITQLFVRNSVWWHACLHVKMNWSKETKNFNVFLNLGLRIISLVNHISYRQVFASDSY